MSAMVSWMASAAARGSAADAGRSREAGGTGLGLAIVKHLVEAHGGSVGADSLEGKGTTIRVAFPDQPRAVES